VPDFGFFVFFAALALLAVLGVKGLGGVFSIRARTASRELSGGLGMDETPKKGRPYGSGAYGTGPYGGYTIPASETEEGKARIRAYYEALGRFVDTYSEVETAIHVTLRHYADTPPEIANIAFASVKADTGMTFIKQIAKATGCQKEVLDDLEDIFNQLGIINGVRNHILHYGASMVAEGKGYVSNAMRAKGQPTEFPMSPDLLDDMWHDLQRILARLYYDHLGRPGPRDEEGLKIPDPHQHAPWKYKYRTLKPVDPTP